MSNIGSESFLLTGLIVGLQYDLGDVGTHLVLHLHASLRAAVHLCLHRSDFNVPLLLNSIVHRTMVHGWLFDYVENNLNDFGQEYMLGLRIDKSNLTVR